RRTDLHLQARTVAIVPRRRRMNLDVERQLEFRSPPQALAQNFFLDLELVLVIRMLVVTSAAAGIVLAARLDAVGGGLDDRVNLRSSESRLLLGERSFNLLRGQNEGDEHGLAAPALFICARIGRQTGQAVSTVDQLFNGE